MERVGELYGASYFSAKTCMAGMDNRYLVEKNMQGIGGINEDDFYINYLLLMTNYFKI